MALSVAKNKPLKKVKCSRKHC